MNRTTLLSIVTAAVLAASAAAQTPCSDNLWPLHLVDPNGVQAPSTTDSVGHHTFQFATEAVYLAFDPTTPTGTYSVHVTSLGHEEVVSTNDPMDRFVHVANNAGVITLSLPFSSNQDPALFGAGLGGVGQSILLKFRSSDFSPCSWKVVLGDKWDLSHGPEYPWLLDGGVHPVTGNCAVRSYDAFRIGDGNGSDVSGLVFGDSDRDGIQDPGEVGVANWQVKLVTPTTELATTTDANGNYRFSNVGSGEYSVEITPKAGFVVTTAANHGIQVCSCADRTVGKFGVAQEILACNAHTIGYWRNHQGLSKVQQFNILPTLPALHIVDASGNYVAPVSLASFKNWLQAATAVNMAYMLSAQLVAMHCNVMVGFVDPAAVIDDPSLGSMTIAQLMQQSVLSLAAHPFTPPGSPWRAEQTALKNALDRANNNLIWQ